MKEKQAADATQQKAVRHQLRRLGFYISDFTADAGGFVESDIDTLIAHGVLTVDEPPPLTEQASSDAPRQADWFWEGSVQDALIAYLVSAGWLIERTADTASRQQGIDVVAVRGERRLAVEVKGFPSTTYARGPKMGQPKPTAPTLQARHWFAGALLTAIATKGKEPAFEVALALPDVPRYRRLFDQTRWAFERLAIGLYLISESGAVTVLVESGQ